MRAGRVRELVLFGIAGTLGFLVDAGVVTLLVNGLGWGPYRARLMSFLCAVAATFAFNRRYTFKAGAEASLLRQGAQYLLAMIGGLAVNYAVYAALVQAFDAVRSWPIIGVAAGSIAGVLVNYLSARYLVFRQHQ